MEVRPGHSPGRLHAHGSLWVCTLQGVSPQPVHSTFEGLAAGTWRPLRPVGPASGGALTFATPSMCSRLCCTGSGTSDQISHLRKAQALDLLSA